MAYSPDPKVIGKDCQAYQASTLLCSLLNDMPLVENLEPEILEFIHLIGDDCSKFAAPDLLCALLDALPDGDPETTGIMLVGADCKQYAADDLIPGTIEFATQAEQEAGIITGKADSPAYNALRRITAPGGGWALGSGGNTRGTDAIDLQVTRTAVTQVASGVNSANLGGAQNTASGANSCVVGGVGNVASGDSANASGSGTTASGDGSHAEGDNTTASGAASHAEGNETIASSLGAHAEGDTTIANTPAAHAEGYDNLAGGETLLFTNYTSATRTFAMTLGAVGNVQPGDTITIVEATLLAPITAIVQGVATPNIVITADVPAGNLGAGQIISERAPLTNGGLYTHVEGTLSRSTSLASHAEGVETLASGAASHAEGSLTVAAGDVAHAEGGGTRAWGAADHAEGASTVASGGGSHAEGNASTASGNGAHAEGNSTTASGIGAHSEGTSTLASDMYAHAEGDTTIASGETSHAEGYRTLASGDKAHAEGSGTTASGDGSHAEGGDTTASGDYSHAEGNNTEAIANFAHAGGTSAVADKLGQFARASGSFTNPGDAQRSRLTLFRAIANHVDQTWYTLYLDGSSALLTMPVDTLWQFRAMIVGLTEGVGQSPSQVQKFSYVIEGTIHNNYGTLQLLESSVTTRYEDDASYDAQAVADSANDALLLQVRRNGGSDFAIRWVASIETVEVTFPTPAP